MGQYFAMVSSVAFAAIYNTVMPVFGAGVDLETSVTNFGILGIAVVVLVKALWWFFNKYDCQRDAIIAELRKELDLEKRRSKAYHDALHDQSGINETVHPEEIRD